MKKIYILLFLSFFIFPYSSFATTFEFYSEINPTTSSISNTNNATNTEIFANPFYWSNFKVAHGTYPTVDFYFENQGFNGPLSWGSVSGVSFEGYSTSTTAGNYFIEITQASTSIKAVACYYTPDGASGWVVTDCAGAYPPDLCTSGDTRICNFNPAEGFVATSTQVSFDLKAYINSVDDDTAFRSVSIRLHNINQNFLGYILPDTLDPNDIYLLEDDAVPSGQFNWNGTTTLAFGNYRLEACIGKFWFGIGNPLPFNFLENLGFDCTSHQFIVGSPTFVGNISQNSFSQINDIYASTTATSTSALAGTCNPISSNISTAFLNTDFSVTSCLAFLFIPDSYYLNQTLVNFKTNVLTHFPLGYITDFYYIMATSTASSLTVIDATIPSGIAGAGSNIRLDLTGVLDPILNATSTRFNNVSASSTETFYEITSVYWDWFIYLSALMYILSRILGKNLIPHGHIKINKYDN